MSGHRFDTEFAASAQNAQADFTPVGNDDFFKHRYFVVIKLMDESSVGICLIWRRPNSLNNKEWLAILDRLAILGQNGGDLAGFV